MAVTEVKVKEFQSMLEMQLFPDSSFYKKSKNAGNASADSVEIPQSAGNDVPILGGVTSGYDDVANNLGDATALTPVIRVNNKKTYSNVIMRAPKPIVFEELQEASLSYVKASNVAEEQGMVLEQAIANYMTIQWAPTIAGNIVETTGLNSAGVVQKRDTTNTTGAKGGYSGAVKRFAYSDLIALSLAVTKQNVEGGNWYALLTPELEEDIFRIPEFAEYNKTGIAGTLASGVVGKWGKINFLPARQNDRWNANVLYDITSTPVKLAYGGTVNSKCSSAMLVWNDKLVERQEGGIRFFSRKNDPIYMGDIVNWGVRIGGTSRRLDEKGVIAVYEAQTTA